MRKIKYLVLHTSDSPDSRTSVNAATISDWHKARGFKSPSGIHIGYHYVICKDGKVEQGRPEEEIGAHVEGKNANSIGVCWVGRDDFNKAQRKEAIALFAKLCKKYGLTERDIYGHNFFSPGKSCPRTDIATFRADVATALAK